MDPPPAADCAAPPSWIYVLGGSGVLERLVLRRVCARANFG
jgi:hypothetical protein